MSVGASIFTFCAVGTIALAACVLSPSVTAFGTLAVCVGGIVVAGRES